MEVQGKITQSAIEAAAEERWPADGDYFNRGGVISSFIEGALWMQGQHSGMRWVIDILQENYEAAKDLTDYDKNRPAQELLIETYEDLISIFKHRIDSSPSPDIERIRQERDNALKLLEELIRSCYRLDIWAKEEMTADQYWEEYKAKHNL